MEHHEQDLGGELQRGHANEVEHVTAASEPDQSASAGDNRAMVTTAVVISTLVVVGLVAAVIVVLMRRRRNLDGPTGSHSSAAIKGNGLAVPSGDGTDQALKHVVISPDTAVAGTSFDELWEENNFVVDELGAVRIESVRRGNPLFGDRAAADPDLMPPRSAAELGVPPTLDDATVL